MDSSLIDPVAYINTMKKTRARRKYFFGTVLIYAPAILFAYKISPTNRVMGAVFGIWFVLLVITTFLVAMSKCPRCGNYFHMNGMTLLLLRKCLHCQLHINTDSITCSKNQ